MIDFFNRNKNYILKDNFIYNFDNSKFQNFRGLNCRDFVKNLFLTGSFYNFSDEVLIEDFYFNLSFLDNKNISRISQYKFRKYSPSKVFYNDEFRRNDLIVLAGGLFSSINSLDKMARFFSERGFEFFSIEITGGTECFGCYNYNFSDLTEVVLPSFFREIRKIEFNKDFIFIGHSNGARTFLEAFSNLNEVPKMVFFLGIPGSFSDSNFLINKFRESQSDFYFLNSSFISMKDVSSIFGGSLSFFGKVFLLKENNLISRNLFFSYLKWIVNDEDAQPRTSSRFNFIKMIGGDILFGHDGIVPVRDQNEIFNFLISDSKKIEIVPLLTHTSMLRDKYIFENILDEILSYDSSNLRGDENE